MPTKIRILVLFLYANILCCAEEVFYSIGSKNVLHKVSDKFLSISVDPAVLLAGANLSDTALLLASNLSPAYIRLAGPSTQFVRYIDYEEENSSPKSEEKSNLLQVTPSMWFGINEWFNLANLTPVYGINDVETEKGVWNPRNTLPLFEISDKFGVACYWQLGYDCSKKTSMQYVEDLNVLRQTLNGYPEHNGTWKIVGSDISRCIYEELENHSFEKYVNDLDENIDAIMWESSLISKSDLGLTKTALWASIPKDTSAVTYSSAIKWAAQVSKAAALKHDVIFRQPRLIEMSFDTPVYWFSFLHKKLMGTNVLEIRSVSMNSDFTVAAHCTRGHKNFVRSGAVTLLMVNDGSDPVTANVRLETILLEKSIEIQSYILSESKQNPTETLLNNRKLTLNMLKRPEQILKPSLRSVNIRPHLSLEVPAKTISFFVLTGAKNPLCINRTEDLEIILKEINENQNDESVSKEKQFSIEGRFRNPGIQKQPSGAMTLKELKNMLLNEAEVDKGFYNTKYKAKGQKMDHAVEEKMGLLQKHLKSFIEQSKKEGLNFDSKKKLFKSKPSPPTSFHLSIKEIEEILKQRAQAKAAARNIQLTSSELEMLLDKATFTLPRHFVSKRDINKLLLEEKANFYKNNLYSQEMYEQHAKKFKLLPLLKFKRNVGKGTRIPRGINSILLNWKAILEEQKDQVVKRNNIQNRSNINSVKNMVLRTKRDTNSNSSSVEISKNNVPVRSRKDINLDLLKKKTGAVAKSVAVQPNLEKKWFSGRNGGRMKIKGQISDEISDFMEMKESLFKNLFSQETLYDASSFDNSLSEENKPKNKKFWSIPKMKFKFSENTKNKPVPLDLMDKFQFLHSSYDDDVFSKIPCNKKGFQYLFSSPKTNKKNTFADLLRVRFGKNKKEENDSLMDFNDLHFLDDLSYDFYRRKRETKTTAKENRMDIKKDVKSKINHVKEMARQLNLKKKNRIKTLAKRSLTSTNLNSLFGQYQPISPGLRPWKPADILHLEQNYIDSLPLYTWVQEQKLKNMMLQAKLFGLRKRRYIEGNSVNSVTNELFSEEEELKEDRKYLEDEYYERANYKVETTTEKLLDTITETQKSVMKTRDVSYLEKVLGRDKAKTLEDYWKKLKTNVNDMGKNIKNFFGKLF